MKHLDVIVKAVTIRSQSGGSIIVVKNNEDIAVRNSCRIRKQTLDPDTYT